jgi:hypothetical protein
MNTTVRSILSSITGISILGFTFVSAFAAGFETTNTVLGMAGLVLWSLAQLLVLDLASAQPAHRVPVRVKAPAEAAVMVAFPCEAETRQAA